MQAKRAQSNRKVASLMGINRETANGHIRRFKELEFGYAELLTLEGKDLEELFTQNSQTEKTGMK